MEFLKNHYEKIILSVVLVGLMGTAGFLALEAVGFRGVMAGTAGLAPKPADPSQSSRTNEFFTHLTNAKAPQEVDFDGNHKIFSPEKIIKNPVTEEVFTASQVGPKNLIVRTIPFTQAEASTRTQNASGQDVVVHQIPSRIRVWGAIDTLGQDSGA